MEEFVQSTPSTDNLDLNISPQPRQATMVKSVVELSDRVTFSAAIWPLLKDSSNPALIQQYPGRVSGSIGFTEADVSI